MRTSCRFEMLMIQNFQKEIVALILCGGNSTRMGIDKAFISYHTQPQVFHLYRLLQPFCLSIFISCNEVQAIQIPDDFQKIVDKNKFIGKGPLTGLLSALEVIQDKHLFVIACDYPLFNEEDIEQLVSTFAQKDKTVVFQNQEGFLEPLVAIYHQDLLKQLKTLHQDFNNSLSQFLKTHNPQIITPKHKEHLQSIDTMQQMEWMQQLITTKIHR